MAGRPKMSDGDWICDDASCENLNFARRTSCNKCGKAKSTTRQHKNSLEIGENIASKSKGLFSAEDWQCSKCGNINWARRSTCNVCNGPRQENKENRTGSGGGFMERGLVEYNEKEDSDGEFDEFGRKKKKFRGQEPNSELKEVPKPEPVYQEKKDTEVEEELEEKVEEEVEEEVDDDDDDEFDASKYDLSASEDEEDEDYAKKRQVKIEPATLETRQSKRRHSSSSSSRSQSSSSSSSGSSRSRSRSPSGSRSSKSQSRSPKRSKR